ncbi:phosphatase PAP2 family protein [Chloroflexota bacterium]
MDDWLVSLVPWGTEAIVWVQAMSTVWLDGIAASLTRLGYEEFYLILLPFFYWCVNRDIGINLAFISLLSAWTNDTIKYIFGIPRPSDPRLRVPLPETSPSFPSGHAQNAVANWGYLAYRLHNKVFTVLAVLLIVGIGLSRIVLGVHYPQDVVAGWLVGTLLLMVYIWVAPRLSGWVTGQATGLQVALAVALPVGLIFVHPADTQGLYPAEGAITPMSALAGLGIGLIMERAWVRFSVDGVWWQRVLRLLVGLAITGALYVGPKLVLPDGLTYGVEAALRFVRYSLLGWAVAFLCPWLFVRLHLARRDGLTASQE